MNVSVVIATHNRRSTLERVLASVLAQEFPAEDYEVVVVVDGSTDGTLEYLQGLRATCPLRIVSQSNQGLAAARNAGLQAAQGSLVLFLDDDILCEPTLLAEHVKAHRRDPLVVFGPILVSPDSPTTLAADWRRSRVEADLARLAQADQPRWPYDFAIAANYSAPRHLLLAAGGFDPEFRTAREEQELGLRLWKKGIPFHYQPAAVGHEVYLKMAPALVQKEAAEFGKNEVRLCRKHPEYRPHSAVARLREGGTGKRLLRRLAVGPYFPAAATNKLLLGLAESLGKVRRWRLASALFTGSHSVALLRGAVQEAESWQKLRKEFGMELPVLLYHGVGPGQSSRHPELNIPPQQFERQVEWLARRGYRGIRPSEWLAWLREGKPLPAKPVLLTFDDAYADLTEFALPVLERHGFGAAIFVVTQEVGGTNKWDDGQGVACHWLMAAKQIRDWARRGIEFGAHSRTHPDLTRLTGTALHEEVAGSGAELAALLGGKVVSFAYPYGHYNDDAVAAAREAFELVFSCDEGLNRLATDPFLLRRTMVVPGDSPVEFGWRVRLGFNPLRRLRARLRLRTRMRTLLRRRREEPR